MPVPSLRAESSECKLECLIDSMSVCRQQFRKYPIRGYRLYYIVLGFVSARAGLE
jgi:hypothetical protein